MKLIASFKDEITPLQMEECHQKMKVDGNIISAGEILPKLGALIRLEADLDYVLNTYSDYLESASEERIMSLSK